MESLICPESEPVMFKVWFDVLCFFLFLISMSYATYPNPFFAFSGLKESTNQWGQSEKHISLHLYSPCVSWITESCSCACFIIMLFPFCLMSPAAKTSAVIEGVECVMDGGRDGEGELMRDMWNQHCVRLSSVCMCISKSSCRGPGSRLSGAHLSTGSRKGSKHTHTHTLVTFHIFLCVWACPPHINDVLGHRVWRAEASE